MNTFIRLYKIFCLYLKTNEFLPILFKNENI